MRFFVTIQSKFANSGFSLKYMSRIDCQKSYKSINIQTLVTEMNILETDTNKTSLSSTVNNIL